MNTPTLLPIAQLVPSPTNPRKHFNEAKLAELAGNLRQFGILQPLLVRPLAGGAAPRFEIVAGERRHRAALLAELVEVPCIVRELSDVQAFEIQLVENLQRDDLTPIEEAEGFHEALRLTLEGKPVHTVASLAARVNKSEEHINARLKLLELPKALRCAVDGGVLPVEQAVAVARIPDEAQRAEAGQRVLDGHGAGQPLTVRETRELIRKEYCRELKGAPFDRKDARLLPGAGSCDTCPHRTGNMPDFDGKRADVCTRPSCYAQKADLTFKRIATEAEVRGFRALPVAEAAKHFDEMGELRHDTPLARLGARPAAHLLKAEVEPGSAPTWAQLVERMRKAKLEVVCFIARNPKTGLVEELLDARTVVAAAEQLGEPVFRTVKSEAPVPVNKRAGEDVDDAFRRGQREARERQEAAAKAQAEQQRRSALVRATALRAVHAALVKRWVPASVWDLMLDWLAPVAALPTLTVWHEALAGAGGVPPAAKWPARLKRLTLEERQALVPLAMLAAPILDEGMRCAGLKALAKFARVDLRSIERDVTKAEEAKAKAKLHRVRPVSNRAKRKAA